MQINFHRLDQEHYRSVIERDDGVRFLVAGVGLKGRLPHDLVHFVVESELGLQGGFWGSVADGAVFSSMTWLYGRRRPHATERGDAVIKANGVAAGAAELIAAIFAEALEEGLKGDELRLAGEILRRWTRRSAGGGTSISRDASVRVCARLREMAERWENTPVGGALSVAWDIPVARAGTAPPEAPRMSEFATDPRIAADSIFLIPLGLSDLRLMNDARYPWLLLVPRVEATELIDLDPEDRTRLLDEIAEVAAALRKATGCHKLNIAALGNVVRQLHVHIIARFTGDAAWPKPVWGVGEAVAYQPGERGWLIAKIRRRPPRLTDKRHDNELFRRPAGGRAERRPPALPATTSSVAATSATRRRTATALTDPAARLYLFEGDKTVLRGNDPLFTIAEAEAFRRHARRGRASWPGHRPVRG